MYKTFILAASIAGMPLSKDRPVVTVQESYIPYAFLLKYSFPEILQPNSPKNAEPYSQNWLGAAQENIRKSEYHFVFEKKLNAWCTPNRKNNLRFFYDDKGFAVEPRTTMIPIGKPDPLQRPGEEKYRYIDNLPTGQAGWKVRFNLDENQVGNGQWQIVNNKAEYRTEKITVEYVNNDEGMRQNFIVHAPLSNNDELKMNFNIKTKLSIYLHGNQVQFFSKKTNVLNYERLKVWDANGKALVASIKKNKRNSFFISVITKNAVYPITIDPLSTSPNSTLDDANQQAALFGCSVGSAGDVNGDGYSDVVIGAEGYDDGANNQEGRAFVYHGSSTGLSASPNSILDDANQGTAQFGHSVSGAGDVNGDGYSDVIVGAVNYTEGANTFEGRAYVYHGSSTGLSASPVSTLDDANISGANFGNSVAGAGDVNGDGYSDVIVGAYQYTDGANTAEGRAFVYHGSASGLLASPTSALDDANQAIANFGYFVASAGDVNGDGYSDVIIGAPNYNDGANTDEGRAFVYHGSAGGLSASPNSLLDDANQVQAQLGYSVSSAGDVNGDGYSDVVAGAYSFDDGANGDEGRAYVYHGSAAGLSASPNSTLDDGNQADALFALSVGCAGDVNGDGYSDVIIGAPWYDDGANVDEGRAYVYHGSSAGLSASPNSTPDDAAQAGAQFGNSVFSAGDVNGDGYSDVVIGAVRYDDGANTIEGRAYVYHGAPAGLSSSPITTPDDANQAGAHFGYTVSLAGDVNSDGYSDVIIGAHLYNDGANSFEGHAFVYHGSATGLSATPNSTLNDANQAGANFGYSVSSAGDINGDGYGDVIVGAYQYQDGANIDEGRAFIYHGSASGLGASPANTPDDANQADARFGSSVACAGDVNADGYSDVIIGAPYYNDGANANEGRAYLYLGTASGLQDSPASIADDANQADAYFGCSVATAGDVNADGKSDVIIGADGYDDGAFTGEGRAFVYYGTGLGLPASPSSIPNDANQTGALFGHQVSCAGDVNGDGISDIIIGAPGYNDGANTLEGRAFIYHGSSGGLSASPNSTPDDANQAVARFGISVSTAGDVNGDGYSDVLIGASYYDDGANTEEGRAFVYYGSSSGLAPSPADIPNDANQATAHFGVSLSTAGDINGDGYSDIIVGANLYDDGGNNDEGRAFIYNGNESATNQRNNIRLYNTDLTTPVNSSNYYNGNFGVGLFAKSFLGRVRAKLVWETRLNYNAFSGSPITNSTFFTSQQSTYTSLGTTGAELKNVVSKILGSTRYTKLRARVKYSPATAITGQLYGPWRYISAVIDGNGLGALPLELISFKATWVQKGKMARLDFVTDKEMGICCFDIEKSTDGFNFFSIGTLPAKNTSGIQSYSFLDNNASGKKQFYRLRITGMTGQAEYSHIQQLLHDKVTEIMVFPNPTTDLLQVQLNGPYDKMQVQVINAEGQMVKRLEVTVINQALTVPVSTLPAGKYWMQLYSGGQKQTLQFVKQ